MTALDLMREYAQRENAAMRPFWDAPSTATGAAVPSKKVEERRRRVFEMSKRMMAKDVAKELGLSRSTVHADLMHYRAKLARSN